MPSPSNHERYMQLALSLAGRAAGRTSPNPLVGAVLVKKGRIIGSGYHRRLGFPHAEVEALRRAGSSARGATLYVSLEPCNHTGRTPPCCDAILKAGVARVVAAIKDPNPITHGRGLARLRQAGVKVRVGVLADEAKALNAPFFKAMQVGLPWVTAKLAQSLDGKIATAAGQSRWITSAFSRKRVHQLRGCADAVLVGINTVLADDPLLSAREGSRRADRPVKVIVDSRLRMPANARCLSAKSRASTFIATTVHSSRREGQLKRQGAAILHFPARYGRVPLKALFQALVRQGIHSVLLEGGGELFAGALAERLVDRLVLFAAPVILGGRKAPSTCGGLGVRKLSRAVRLDKMTVNRIGPDLCIEGNIVYP